MNAAPTRRLDTTGRRCPVPVLMTARVMSTLELGARLDVIGDDPEMLVDIPAWCEQSGNRLLAIEQAGALVVCRLERADGPRIEPRS